MPHLLETERAYPPADGASGRRGRGQVVKRRVQVAALLYRVTRENSRPSHF